MNEQFIIVSSIMLVFLISVFIENFVRFYKLLFKNQITKNTTLNCGIFAWSGNSNDKFTKAKFDILGIYNDSRGGDGCGISKNSEIIKNIKKDKYFKNFLINKNYNNDLENNYIIGHTRNSSKGLKNEENTHPFGFGEDKNKGYEFIGVHNGTLYNENDIAKKYKCNKFKNDSSILLEAIFNSKSFKPLSEYLGAAATVFTNTNEPNTIYAFRGESKKYKNDKNTEKERPLYYYQESKNSLYISSMEESLIAITENEKDIEKIFEFKFNTVYKIKDGNVEKAETFKISRQKMTQRIQYSNHSNYNNEVPNHWKENKISDNVDKITNNYKNRRSRRLKNSSNDTSNVFKIKDEVISNKDRKRNKIVFENFLYRRNGHVTNGIFIYTKEEKFIYLEEDLVDAYQVFFTDYLGKPYDKISGKFKKSISEIKHEDYYIPFDARIYNDYENYPFIYIVDGIRVIRKSDYNVLNTQKAKNSLDFIEKASWCATHPILNRKREAIKNGNKIEFMRFNPLNSDFIYTIVNGSVTTRKNNYSDNFLNGIKLEDEIITADQYTGKVIKLNSINEKEISKFDEITSTLSNKEINELKRKGNEIIKLFDLEPYTEKENEETLEKFSFLFSKMENMYNKYMIRKRESFNKIEDCNYSKQMTSAIDNFGKELEEINNNLLINS